MSSCFYEKSKMYYEKYKAGKLTKKVGSVVKKGDKYLTTLRTDKRPMFAGGSVDEGTTIKWCTSKELEELGMWGATLELVKRLKKKTLASNTNYKSSTFALIKF